jgi:hypothetical protein
MVGGDGMFPVPGRRGGAAEDSRWGGGNFGALELVPERHIM